MNKGLTIDSRWRDENGVMQNTRDEFGIISREQATRIIKRYLADEDKDIQITWEARRTTYNEVLTELTQYLMDKKRISIKYALPVAERIIQMVEKDWECGN